MGENERVYMREIIDVNTKSIPSANSLHLSLHDINSMVRDPRANHLAARARIEEDERNATALEMKEEDEARVEVIAEESKMDLITCMKRESSETKLIESNMPRAAREEGPVKRVRFADDIVLEDMKEKDNLFIRPKPSSIAASQVPDHIKNPSKYTRYTLDWSVEDNDDTTNLQALDACFETRKTNQSKESDDIIEETPKKIHYIPRKSVRETIEKTETGDVHHQATIMHSHRSRMCIDQFEKESETIMELDDDDIMKTKIVSSSAIPRRYRSKKETETTDGDLLRSL